MLVYWVWFAMLQGVSLRQKMVLLERFSDPEEIYYSEQMLSEDKDLSSAQSVITQCKQKNIGILPFGDAAYPARLRNISDPPLVLYYKGVIPDFENRPSIGVVGTRKASAYGLSNAQKMSRQIAACGGIVVSGGADGVDSRALQGALEADGQTVTVLGCGVDVVYPRTNRRLFMDVTENGCLLSEYLPGTQPKPWLFPQRNRIISGISNGVLVVEAPERSGALITARNAMEQGRDVFAVPGNIGVKTCAGSNALLQEGAYAVFSGWDALEEYAPQYPKTVSRQGAKPAPALPEAVPEQPVSDKKDIDNTATRPYSVFVDENIGLTGQEQQLLAVIERKPKPVDEVIARADMPAATVLSMLTKLALRGLVINHPGKLVSRK